MSYHKIPYPFFIGMVLTLFAAMPAVAFEGDTTVTGTHHFGLSATGGSGTLTINSGALVTNINNGNAVNLQNFNYTVVNKGKVGGFALVKKGECTLGFKVETICDSPFGFGCITLRVFQQICTPDISGNNTNGIFSSGNAQVINSGTITGTTQGIHIAGDGSVENSGTIEQGIFIGGTSTLINRGTISGGVSLGTTTGSPVTVINSGTISGNPAFHTGAGNDTIILEKDSFTGSFGTLEGDDSIILRSSDLTFTGIDTGLGTDTLILQETGTLTSVNLLFNLEKLRMEGTDWTLGETVIFSQIQIDNGTLRTPYSLNGPVTINPNGTLINTGSIFGDISNHGKIINSGPITGNVVNNGTFTSPSSIFGNFTNNGTLSPGNSIGTFHVNGNYTHGSTGNLIIEFDNTQSDLLDVTGTAKLNFGTVTFTPTGLLVNSNTYTFLQSSGLTGGFNTVTSPLFLDTTVNVAGNNMEATLTRNASYESQASTGTQQKIAATLDGSLATATGDLAELMLALDQSDTTQDFQEGLDQLSPEPVTALAPATFTNSQMYNHMILQRLGNRRQGISTATSPGEGLPLLAMNAGDPGQLAQLLPGGPANLETGGPEQKKNWRFFARTFGNFSNLDSEGTTTGFTANTFGLSMGADKQTNDRWLFGGSFGWSYTGQEYDLPNWDATINTLRLAGHAGYTGDRWFADGILSYALNMYDSERIVQVGGFNRVAEGSHVGNEFSLYLGGGYHLLNGDWQVGPIGSMQYITLLEEGFEETGAGNAGLKFDSTNTNSLRSTLGFAVNRRFILENGTVLIPQARAQWAHEWMDTEFTVNAQFLGAAGSSFEIQGKDLGSDSVLAGAGLIAHWSDRLMTSLNYHVDVGRTGFTSHMFDLRLSYRF